MVVTLEKMPGYEHVELPQYAYEGDSGADVKFALSLESTYHGFQILPNTVEMLRTGLKVANILPGYEIQVRSRSGLAKKGIIVANSPGTVDNQYRGEICVLLANLTPNSYFVCRGDKIAQLVVVPVRQAIFQFGKTVVSQRGEGGFGSTGQ